MSGNTALAEKLVATLPAGLPGLFNPWVDQGSDDTEWNSAAARLARLAAHLDCAPEFVIVGEASGYLGMRRSALAFTSERQLMEGAIPRVTPPPGRLTTRRLPYSEPSATIVWKTLKHLGIAERAVMWNALPMHPFKHGNAESNRTPTDAELMQGAPAMRILADAFPRAKIVAVGRKAEALLLAMGIHTVGQVRHPANGGANAFAAGMAALMDDAPCEVDSKPGQAAVSRPAIPVGQIHF